MHFLNWPIITYPQFQLIKGLQGYLPQHCLYFFPLPQGYHLKQPRNFLLKNWAFLLINFNNLLANCKKVMSNFLTMQFKLI